MLLLLLPRGKNHRRPFPFLPLLTQKISPPSPRRDGTDRCLQQAAKEGKGERKRGAGGFFGGSETKDDPSPSPLSLLLLLRFPFRVLLLSLRDKNFLLVGEGFFPSADG